MVVIQLNNRNESKHEKASIWMLFSVFSHRGMSIKSTLMVMICVNNEEGSEGSDEFMNPFTKQVIHIIKDIPAGYVMTYGQIAKLAGSARGARQVVRILHSMSKTYQLPWHRVINSKGEIAIKDDESRFMQMAYLKEEGVIPDENGFISLEKYRYMPVMESIDVEEGMDLN